MKSGQAERLWKLQTSASSLVLEGKRNPDPLVEFLQKFVFGSDLGAELWLETSKALGLEDEYREAAKKLVFPEDQNVWFVPMAKGITSNKIVAGHRRLGVKYYLFADDLDKAIHTHDRDANRDGSYIVGFRSNVEADEEFKNLSANQLAERNHKGICLPERLWMGTGYYVATGQHLDIETATLCPGSRDCDGDVPSVGWDAGVREVDVDWYYPDDRYDSVRSRSVVFQNPPA